MLRSFLLFTCLLGLAGPGQSDEPKKLSDVDITKKLLDAVNALK